MCEACLVVQGVWMCFDLLVLSVFVCTSVALLRLKLRKLLAVFGGCE